MKHTIRRNGQLNQIDCELGSGRFDINGKEICEGDRVRDYDPNGECVMDCYVVFEGGTLWAEGTIDLPISDFDDGELEVVGHIGDNVSD